MADAEKIARLLMQTWPARMVQGATNAVMAPGRALASTEPVTTEQMIAPAADLAGLMTLGAGAMPAGANELRAGIRPYQNVPDSLMGYRKSGQQKGFGDAKYLHEQPVEVVLSNGEKFTDAMMGMSPDHAMERAWRNWPDAKHINAIAEMEPFVPVKVGN